MSKMKKSVIVAGMPRAGSTWLYYNLRNHPQIAMPIYKETFFFGSSFYKGFDWYYSLYASDIEDKVAFDISPNYFCDDNFFDNVGQFDVEHKVILILREPAEWLVSLYSQLKSFTPNMPPLEQYLNEIRIDFDGGSYTIKPSQFQFEEVVRKFEELYKGRLLLINFDEIKKNPVRVLNEIEKFSGLDRFFYKNNTHINPVNVSIPKFNLVAYLGTKPFVRKTAIAILPRFVQDRIVDYIYKVNKKSAKNMTYVSELEKRFKPMYAKKYFREDNIVYL